MTNSPYQLFILRCKKSRFTYSAHTQQLTALFLVIFELLCLTSYPRFWTNSRKMYYLCRRKAASQQNIQASLIFCIRFAFSLKKKSCISAKYSSKLDILHSICIFFKEEKLHLSKIFKQAWYSAFDLHFL